MYRSWNGIIKLSPSITLYKKKVLSAISYFFQAEASLESSYCQRIQLLKSQGEGKWEVVGMSCSAFSGTWLNKDKIKVYPVQEDLIASDSCLEIWGYLRCVVAVVPRVTFPWFFFFSVLYVESCHQQLWQVLSLLFHAFWHWNGWIIVNFFWTKFWFCWFQSLIDPFSLPFSLVSLCFAGHGA